MARLLQRFASLLISRWLLVIVSGLILVFIYLPIVLIIVQAFNPDRAAQWPPGGFSLHWLEIGLASPGLRDAMQASLVAALGATALALVLGSLAALAVARFRFFGRETMSFVVLLPLALPGIVTAVALRSTFSSLDTQLGMFTIILGHATFCIVIVYNNVLARERRSVKSPEEASMDLGADAFQTFRRITLPQLGTALVAGGLLAFALSFDELIVTNFLAGGVKTLPIWIMQNFRLANQTPIVNVAAMIAILLSIIPVYIAQRLAGAEFSADALSAVGIRGMVARMRVARSLTSAGLVVLLALSAPAAEASSGGPRLAGCPVFPAKNVWNRRVDRLPVHPDSARLMRSIGLDAPLHPDFGSFDGYGIPWNVVDGITPRTAVSFTWPEESDAGPYPIPDGPSVEGGSDQHILMVDRDACLLYELFAAERAPDGRWTAGSGAIWDLRSNGLRPRGWTSADAAGLPILAGLVRRGEVADGAIRHALRFTAPRTRRAFIYPARHFASDSTDPDLPPMGLRVRLKRSVDIGGFPRQARAVLRALQRYGMILADNGSPWYVTGAPDPRWDDDALHALGRITGADFEAVDTRGLRNP